MCRNADASELETGGREIRVIGERESLAAEAEQEGEQAALRRGI